MEKYLIFKKTSDTNREYVYQIGRNNIYTNADMGDGIEFSDKETATLVAKYISNRSTTKYYVLSVITTIEVLEGEGK